MELSDQVCSLELAKRLKELGVKQSSEFYFVSVKKIGDATLLNEIFLISHKSQCNESSSLSAFTVAELGEILMDFSIKNISHIELDFYTTYHSHNIVIKPTKVTGIDSYYINDKNESNTRAKTLIWLIENGHVKEKV
jgi:hypothetical protein